MGKSTTAMILKSMGVPVFDADAVVHELMKPGTLVSSEIESKFPGVSGAKGIDRQKLGRRVFEDSKALEDLEHIVHPRVQAARNIFLRQAAMKRFSIVALDIPLLLEGKNENQIDKIMVASAPLFLQRQRALARSGMTPEKFKAIVKHQMPDAKKRKLADIVVPTGLGKRGALRTVSKFLKRVKQSHMRNQFDLV